MDCCEQSDSHVGVEGTAAPWVVAPVLVGDLGGEQRGRFVVPAGVVRDVGQGSGEGSVLNVGSQQVECLVVPAVAGEQPCVEFQCQRVPGLQA